MYDGHTSLKVPFKKLLSPDDDLFPYVVKANIEKPYLVVNEKISDDLTQIPNGAEILSINNISAEDIIQKIIDNTSGESRIYKLKMGADRFMFGFVLNAYYDLGKNYTVKYEYNGTITEKQIPSLVYKELNDLLKKMPKKEANKGNSPEIKDYSLILKPEEKTAIIDFRYFNDEEKFKSFLKESFTEIKAKKIKNLIIDIRQNGGGDSSLGDELLKYISNKPFKQFDKTIVKYSQLQKEFYDEKCKTEKQFCDTYNYIKSKTNGEIEVLPSNDLISLNSKSDQFNGKVYLLTSTRTFSSAMNFAQAFEYYKVGTIVGEETGGQIVSFGDIITTSLPISEISLSISTKKFYTVGATDKDVRGVLPNIQQSAKTTLDYVLSLIAKQK